MTDLSKMTMKELYAKRDQFLRIKDSASQQAFSYDQEIERRKESGEINVRKEP